MFINKASDGKNNLCGEKIALRRSQMGISQRELADRLRIALTFSRYLARILSPTGFVR